MRNIVYSHGPLGPHTGYSLVLPVWTDTEVGVSGGSRGSSDSPTRPPVRCPDCGRLLIFCVCVAGVDY